MSEWQVGVGRWAGPLTDVGDHLLGGAGVQVGELQDGVTVRLHGGPGDGAQPVVRCVVQLGKVIP